jgi:hypothetical protein
MRTLRTLHKWLGLLVFIQVLIWMGSGFIISLIGMEEAAGRTSLAAPPDPRPLSPQSILPVHTLSLEREGLQSVRLAWLDNRPVYRIQYPQGVRLLDARRGDPVVVNASSARRIAQVSYNGIGELTGVERIDNPEELVKFDGTVWRVSFDDDVGTQVYVDAADGRVVAHRNDSAALLEFLLMLHFMDYNGGHDFNHPLIIGFGFATLWLAATGVLLLISSLRRVGLR